MPAAVHVSGFLELSRAFKEYGKDAKKELREEFKQVAEPMRRDAERFAATSIGNIGPRWSQMRVGVSQKLVYVAPKSRNRGGPKRRNLAGLLATRALEPSLAHNAGAVADAAGDALDRLGRRWARGG